MLWKEPMMADVWLRRAADGGDAEAAEALRSVANNRIDTLDEAVEFFEEGRGLDIANLGVLLETHGRAEEARDWYLKAQERGDAYGAFRLAKLAEGAGERKTALGWYRRAAEMGHPGAERFLAERRGAAGTVNE
ncbi:hypothetical protein [Streptomyces sirii]|uniref:hypothetical protein n=1 Tax=Streptomyces sirii TaxID=3127701 RepID=UPI003D3680A0